MGKKEKLVERLKRLPKDFTYNEAMALLLAIGFVEDNKGGTSGFRVLFRKDGIGQALMFHKPHPQKELKPYVVKMILDYLIRHNQI